MALYYRQRNRKNQMANMSYCRFENTSNDLRDCVRAMEDADDIPGLELNQYETAAYQHMVQLCSEFMAQHERLSASTTVDSLSD